MNDAAPSPLAVILLCAGRSTRMGTRRLSKVCLPVAGIPAVIRTLGAFRACGATAPVIVIGQDSADVLRVVSAEFPEALFVVQPEPRGTGDAVVRAARALRAAGFAGDVFVCVGDKVLDAAAAAQVLQAFRRSRPDLALAVSEKPEAADMGRLVYDAAGRPLGVVEAPELRLAALEERLAALARRGRPVTPEALRALCTETLGSEKPLARRPALAALVAEGRPVRGARLLAALEAPGRVRLGRVAVERSLVLSGPPHMNESLYLFTASALERGADLLAAQPVFGECYATDLVHLLVQDEPPRRVEAVVMDPSALIVGFNTPAQLLQLEERLRQREGRTTAVVRRDHGLPRRACRPVAEWLRLFEGRSPSLLRALRDLYGAQDDAPERKRREIAEVLRVFARRFGSDRPAVIARAPGSVNLMGRHVDVEGGFVNLMPINREALFVAAARSDDRIRVAAAGAGFGDAEFTIGGELAALDWDDWLKYVSSAKVREMVAAARDNRSNYVKAAVLRLQQQFHDLRIAGMDCAASCAVPSAAGLGASGAIVAAALRAAAALNGLALDREAMATLCAEGLWYVSRDAGSGEHVGAHLSGGRVSQVRFQPFEVRAETPFPDAWRLLLCMVRDAPRLSLALRARRAAEMHLSVLLLRARFPRFEHLIERICDLDRVRLGVAPSEIYAMLGALPSSASPAQMQALLPASRHGELAQVLAAHEPPARWLLRDVALFGAAECARAQALMDVLREHDAAALGELMAASHDAERVGKTPDSPPLAADDVALQRLIGDLRSEDPERTRRAQLLYQPGWYGSSTAALDGLVDALRRMPGVVGAQLSGGGQGGCVMAIVRAEAADDVRRRLQRASVAPEVDVVPVGPAPAPALLTT